MTDYEGVAQSGAYERRYEDGRYVATTRAISEFVGAAPRVLEVGCGTGHFLAALAGRDAVGLDASAGMLARARARLPDARLIRGRAEALPFASAAFDRVLIVNALHHFAAPEAVLAGVRRVLHDAGAVMIVGLDPSLGADRWPVYDWFEGTLARDRARFPSAASLRTSLTKAGFARASTVSVETFAEVVPAREALASGALAKHTTSQLSDLDDAAYCAGLARIAQAARVAEASGSVLRLETHLTLHATYGWSL
ncbi:MAG: class I SAM-dependent methyltransferase [Polyangiales bacterium]